MSSALLFDRARVRLHRDRAAARLPEHDFLLREVAARMGDRLDDVKRRFPSALILGAHSGQLATLIAPKVDWLVQADLSSGMIHQAEGPRLAADEEFLPFADNSFDLILSCCSLQWVNDLPGALIQIRKALKPDGWFLAALPGGQTLKELRDSLERAEQKVSGGLSPRVSPFVDVKDAGSLLQRAGFTLPVVDSETLNVRYLNPLELLRDLRGGGQTNSMLQGKKGMAPRTLIYETINDYLQLAGTDGRVPATFELVTLTGWKQA